MRFTRLSKRRAAFFDMTPMIDVVMQLLIFFMFTSQFAQVMRSPIDLPAEPGETRQEEDPATVVVDVRVDGTLLVESRVTPADRVLALIAGEQAASPGGVRVLVRADRLAPTEHINRLAMHLARLGVRDWRLGTREIAAEQPGGTR